MVCSKVKDRFVRFVFHEIRQPMNCVVLGAPNAAAQLLDQHR